LVDLTKLEIKFRNLDSFRIILGSNDTNLKVLKSLYNLEIFTKGEDIYTSSKDSEIIKLLEKIFEVLIMIASNNVIISERDIIYIASLSEKISKEDIVDIYVNRMFITKTLSGKPIYAKTLNQKEYIKAINRDDLVFAIGPAGTGKTYIAVVNALAKLKKSEVKKIILTRPAVEAGESLGFLPGDLKEKVDLLQLEMHQGSMTVLVL
jgi:phosphate starvation-inducible PhoH-like protein